MSQRTDIKRQLSFADINDSYQQFVDKFKPKKTTDDCYTPPLVFDAIAGWVAEEYGVDAANFVRPFFPGGDYERYPYKADDIVMDNPPFSIVSKICKFYDANNIKYFLFAPHLTNFGPHGAHAHIITDADIEYENGAIVKTSFLTNLDPCLARTAPELSRRVNAAVAKLRRENKSELPKYIYPDCVLTAAAMGKLCHYGVDFRVARSDGYFIRRLDAMIETDKAIFGGGYLLSARAAAERAAAERAAAERAAAERAAAERAAAERAAAERAAAERAAAERAAAVRWELSEREIKIQKSLSVGGVIIMLIPDSGLIKSETVYSGRDLMGDIEYMVQYMSKYHRLAKLDYAYIRYLLYRSYNEMEKERTAKYA